MKLRVLIISLVLTIAMGLFAACFATSALTTQPSSVNNVSTTGTNTTGTNSTATNEAASNSNYDQIKIVRNNKDLGFILSLFYCTNFSLEP